MSVTESNYISKKVRHKKSTIIFPVIQETADFSTVMQMAYVSVLVCVIILHNFFMCSSYSFQSADQMTQCFHFYCSSKKIFMI